MRSQYLSKENNKNKRQKLLRSFKDTYTTQYWLQNTIYQIVNRNQGSLTMTETEKNKRILNMKYNEAVKKWPTKNDTWTNLDYVPTT